MGITWKDQFKRTVIVGMIVILLALVVNAVRTPVLNAAADQGKMSHARAWELSGLQLVDNWAHGGWRNVAKPDENTNPADVHKSPDDNQVWPINSITAKQFFDEGECIFLDARAPEYYEEGHIPGALNWPSDDFDLYYDQLIDQVPKDSCVVAYCIGGACDESYHLATSLLIEGWQEVYLYEGGITEWKAAGFPMATGSEPTQESGAETEPVEE